MKYKYYAKKIILSNKTGGYVRVPKEYKGEKILFTEDGVVDGFEFDKVVPSSGKLLFNKLVIGKRYHFYII